MSLAGNAAWLAAGSYNCRWLPRQTPLGCMRHDDDTPRQKHHHSGRPPVAFEMSFNSAGDAKDDHNIIQLPIQDSGRPKAVCEVSVDSAGDTEDDHNITQLYAK